MRIRRSCRVIIAAAGWMSSSSCATPARGLLEPLREPVHAALAGCFGGAAIVRPLVAGAANLLGPQGGDLLEGEQLLAVAGQGGPQRGARLPDRGVEDLLERAVLAQQLDGRLLADALGA